MPRIPGNVTHTYVELEVSAVAYDEIAAKLREAGYHHSFDGDLAIDMHGIALTRTPNSQAAARQREVPNPPTGEPAAGEAV